MGNAKRWYIYITSTVSLHALTWAVITLLRNLLVGSISAGLDIAAYQISVILVALPVYLVHWLWAQRLARGSKEEQGSFQRCLYLYIVMAGVLGPFINNVFRLLVDWIIWNEAFAIAINIIPMVVLAIIYFYHQMELKNDIKSLGEEVGAPTVRRLFGLAFTAVGLVMTTMASYTVLHWLFYQFGGQLIRSNAGRVIGPEVFRLVIGMTIWAVFWNSLQRLFKTSTEEQHATSRRVYLYLVVFIAVITTVSTIAGILASLIRRLIIRGGASSGDIRDALPVLIVMGTVWFLHATIIRDDDGKAGTDPSQEGIRRAYQYLVAAIGFAALIIGLGGILNDIIYTIGTRIAFGNELKESLSYYIAAILTGGFTWIIPWRTLQSESVEEEAREARRAMARRIYLYFFLFVSVMTLLSSLVFIVYQILLTILGQQRFDLSDLSGAISGSVIAGAVLFYNGSILRADDRQMEKEKMASLTEMHVSILDGGEGDYGAKLKKALMEEFPGLEPTAIGLSTTARETMDTKIKEKDIPKNLSEARLVIGPWYALADLEGTSPEISKAVVASSAQKLLLPTSTSGFDWIGLEKLDEETLVPKTIKAVKQILAGEEVVVKRSIGCASIFGTVMALLIILSIVSLVISYFYY